MMMQRIRHKSFEKQNRRLMNGISAVIIGLLLIPQILNAGEIENLFQTTKTAYVTLDKTLAGDLIAIEFQIDQQMPLVEQDIKNAGEALETQISKITKPLKDISDLVITDAIAELKKKIDKANGKLTKASKLRKGIVQTTLDTAKDTCAIDVTQLDIKKTIPEIYASGKSDVHLVLHYLGEEVQSDIAWQFEDSKLGITKVLEVIKKSVPFKIPEVEIP